MNQKIKNAFYAQSGGVTSVINATAQGVIEEARCHQDIIPTTYAGKNGILGLLNEQLIDTNQLDASTLQKIGKTPGGFFGSCRFKLPAFENQPTYYQRLIEVMKNYNIGYFFYNGGGDSQDTANKIANACQTLHYPLNCIGIPKTIDNDLPQTHCSPGFASVARYVALSTMEAALDIRSMCASSTKVFIMEVMGRNAGWIAAAAGFIKKSPQHPPHIILFPEQKFNEDAWLKNVQKTVQEQGFCVVVVSEGIRYANNKFVSQSNQVDAFGHQQLGGVAPKLAQIINDKLSFKTHWSVPDYLQRSAKHCGSELDYQHAYALGKYAVQMAVDGKTGMAPIITVDQHKNWTITTTSLDQMANVEKQLPSHFMTEDGFGITPACQDYLALFFQGKDRLPNYAWEQPNLVKKQCPPWKQDA